jgi:osmotically-inducible protein OsmY
MNDAFKGSRLLMAVFLAVLAGCASTGSGEKAGAYVDDSWITTKVKSELAVEGDTKAHNIGVSTSVGVVTLTGTAGSMQESQKAAEIARNVKGVTGVENQILVQ